MWMLLTVQCVDLQTHSELPVVLIVDKVSDTEQRSVATHLSEVTS